MYDDETLSKMTGLPIDKISIERVSERLRLTLVAATLMGPLQKWDEMRALLEEAAGYADALAKAKAAGL